MLPVHDEKHDMRSTTGTEAGREEGEGEEGGERTRVLWSVCGKWKEG